MPTPLVTAIVSTYSAERFMRGCLDDLVAQTVFNEMEVVVIDSGSPQDEKLICEEYCRRHPNIRYLRTEREPLYAAWNRAIGLASGKYLTSANTDDRHACNALELLTGALERDKGFAVASSNQYISRVENQSFEACSATHPPILKYPAFSPRELIFNCTVGSQPVWRASLHADLGLFDASYRISGDHEFWLRVAQRFSFLRLSECLGTFLVSDHTLSGAGNSFARELETMRAQLWYVNALPWRNLSGLKSELATELMSVGYRFVKQRQHSMAQPFLRAAYTLAPWRIDLLKTYLVRGILQSNIGLSTAL